MTSDTILYITPCHAFVSYIVLFFFQNYQFCNLVMTFVIVWRLWRVVKVVDFKPVCLSQLWFRIPTGTFDSFMWGSYQARNNTRRADVKPNQKMWELYDFSLTFTYLPQLCHKWINDQHWIIVIYMMCMANCDNTSSYFYAFDMTLLLY
jgi:hypothetical protein